MVASSWAVGGTYPSTPLAPPESPLCRAGGFFMKRFWTRPKFGEILHGDLFLIMDRLGVPELAVSMLDAGLVRADDVFDAWLEDGRWRVEPSGRLGWGYGVSPSAERLPGPFGSGSHEPFDPETGELLGDWPEQGVRLDNTLHK